MLINETTGQTKTTDLEPYAQLSSSGLSRKLFLNKFSIFQIFFYENEDLFKSFVIRCVMMALKNAKILDLIF